MAIFIILPVCAIACYGLIMLSMHNLRKTTKRYVNTMVEFEETLKKFKNDLHDLETQFAEEVDRIIFKR